MTKIYDCFQYFNEKEILELRIKLLQDYVDGFIIVEANYTHSGIPKPFTCLNTLKDLGLMSSKINLQELRFSLTDTGYNSTWLREHSQRNCLAEFFNDDDIYFVSDCDEIIHPMFISPITKIIESNPDKIFRFPLWFLHCKANRVIVNPDGLPVLFKSPFACKKQVLEKYTLTEIRTSVACGTELDLVEFTSTVGNDKLMPTGWHFSWMGDKERQKLKMRSFSHWQDYDPTLMSDAVDQTIGSPTMQEFFETYEPTVGNTDLFGRKGYRLENFPLEYLPELIFTTPNLENFLLK